MSFRLVLFAAEFVERIDVAVWVVKLRSKAKADEVGGEIAESAPNHGTDEDALIRIVEMNADAACSVVKFKIETAVNRHQQFCTGAVCVSASLRALRDVVNPENPFKFKVLGLHNR